MKKKTIEKDGSIETGKSRMKIISMAMAHNYMQENESSSAVHLYFVLF